MLRCAMCARPAGDNPDAQARERQAQADAKSTGKVIRPVWVCPTCASRTRHEAEEGGHGLRRKD